MPFLYRKRGWWYVGYRTADGWQRESLKTKSRHAARECLPRFERRERAESAPSATRVSLTEFVAYYLEYRKERLTEGSFRAQEKYRIPRFERYLLEAGVRALDEVSDRHIQAYATAIAADVSPSYVRSTLFLISLMFRTAVKWGMAESDPTEDVGAPRVADTRKSRALSEEEVEKLLAATDGAAIGPLIATAVFAGLRKGELINLEWKDIDWDSGFINVLNKKGERAFTTKSGRNRRVPIHRRLRDLLWPLRREDDVLKAEIAKWV